MRRPAKPPDTRPARTRDKARADAEQAERLLAVAKQQLANLLGPLADMTPVDDRSRLSEMVLVAPLAGRIEERQAVQSARITVWRSTVYDR